MSSMAGLEEWSLSHNGVIVYKSGVAFIGTKVQNGGVTFDGTEVYNGLNQFAIVKYLVMLQLYSSLSHNGSQVAVKQLDNWLADRATRGGRGVS